MRHVGELFKIVMVVTGGKGAELIESVERFERWLLEGWLVSAVSRHVLGGFPN
jgi:hypothetical protein